MKIFQATFFTVSVLCSNVFAQIVPTWDISGNGQLSGIYNFRQVMYFAADTAGNLSREEALYGTITFDGAGTYSLSGSLVDSAGTPFTPSGYAATGTYSIAASGFGWISGPVSSNDLVYGLVSNGIFIGSSTQSGFNDLLIAAPAGTTAATNATFSGNYWITDLNLPSTTTTAAGSSLFELNADGNGNIGPFNLTGHLGSSAAMMLNQSITSATYAFTAGVGTLSFPAAPSAQTLVAGAKTMYISPDGNFVFGGSAGGWDIFAGVRAASGTLTNSSFTGLYYQAGIDLDVSLFPSGPVTLAGYYGSLNTASGQAIGHLRLNSLPISVPFDYTYEDSYSLNTDGTYDDDFLSTSYIVGAGGMRVGFDVGPYLGINIALPAPVTTGSGVFLSPQGIVNAASFAPFTAAIAPGEFITLFGTNLAAAPMGDTEIPVPPTLGGAQVLIDGVAAPVFYVSPTQISAIVPYATPAGVANVQVVSGGVASNVVSTYVRDTAPGLFTASSNGLGYGAVLHLDYSLMTPDNPANAGETLAAFVAGLGAVDPAVPDGAAGPLLTATTNQIGVIIDNQVATVSYAGLAPGWVGLYQINFVVPTGIHSGDIYLQIAGPDSLTAEGRLSIAAGPGTLSPALGRAPARPTRFRGQQVRPQSD